MHVYNKEDDLFRIKDICVSLSSSQTQSKEWLVKHLPEYINALVIGGWYGRLPNMMGGKVYSIDLDPGCAKYGKMIYPNVKFKTGCGFNEAMKYEYDMYVCTACEHILQEDLDFLIASRAGSKFVLQSNNYRDSVEHINCKDSLDEFVSEFNFNNIIYQGEIDTGIMKRWMVIGQ